MSIVFITQALFDVDANWHDATVIDVSLRPRRCRVSFDEWRIERTLAADEFRAAPHNVDVEELCELCLCPRKLTEHHLVPRELHGQFRKKGFTKEFEAAVEQDIQLYYKSIFGSVAYRQWLAARSSSPYKFDAGWSSYWKKINGEKIY